jgi:hypothetical protein
MVFPRDVTEREEDILITNLRAVKERTRDTFNQAYAQLGKRRFDYVAKVPGVGAGVDLARTRTDILRLGVDDFFKLGKTDNHTYYFGYAWEDLRALNIKIKALGLSIQLPEPSLISEGKIVTGLKKFVFPDMGFFPESIKVTVTEEAPEGI